MTQPPNYPDSDQPNPTDRSTGRSPWVYVAAVIGAILLLVILHLTGVVG